MKHVLRIVTAAAYFLIAACGHVEQPSPKQGVELVQHGLNLESCFQQGKEAGSYKAYEACKKDAGIE